MPFQRPILAAALVVTVLGATAPVAPAQADGPQCLTPAQRRHVSASGKIVPLSKAIRAASARRAEVVDAKLCTSPKGLVYLLTLLAQDGKVTRATVDAESGTLTDGG